MPTGEPYIIIAEAHIGKRGVFRVPGKSAPVEGVVQEVADAPENAEQAGLFRINESTWIPNEPGACLAFLPDRQLDTGKPVRTSPFARK